MGTKYNLLIVDDEQLERQAIKFIVERRCPCIEVVGEADEGEHALKLAAECRPDIILMDIRMPAMNGLEAVRRVRGILPKARVIFLTAFDEFNYAKEAVKLGAVDYLLKPVRPDELIRSITDVIEEIKVEQAGEIEKAALRKQLEQAVPFIQMSFIYDLISGNISSNNEILERAAFLNLDFRAAIVLVIDIDDFAGLTIDSDELSKQILKQKVYKAVSDAVGTAAMVTPFGGDSLIVLLGFMEFEPAPAKQLSIITAEKIRRCVAESLGITVTVGIGRFYSDVSETRKSYYEAIKAKEQKFFCGGNQVIHVDDLPHLAKISPISYPFSLEKAVLEKVRCGERQLAREGLERLMAELCAGNVGVDSVKISMLELLIVMSRAAAEGGASLEFTLQNQQCINAIIGCRTLEEVRRHMLDSLNRLIDSMLENRVSTNMRLINKAAEFIVQNCHNNLSLDEVAQSVHLSPYYFSRLFKQQKGCNFVEFLTSTRIGLAQKMLRETDDSIVQIALKVGYQDTSYFCRVFRQETGQTPNQYRNKIGKIQRV